MAKAIFLAHFMLKETQMEQVESISANGTDSGDTLAKKINIWLADHPDVLIVERIILPMQGVDGLVAFIFYKNAL
jgi:hypothetical protein